MLFFLTADEWRILMGLTFFTLGVIALSAGLTLLIIGPYRKEAKIIAGQSARISQKALTENITGVVQSATALVEAINNLIRTSSGNAIVLIVVGAILQAAAYRLLIVGG
ncbi:MAG: hypothetical protein RMK99_03745 [Anaerolineales bacterium]|nr:hypothetical protein [Anaerolineales bacterium]